MKVSPPCYSYCHSRNEFNKHTRTYHVCVSAKLRDTSKNCLAPVARACKPQSGGEAEHVTVSCTSRHLHHHRRHMTDGRLPPPVKMLIKIAFLWLFMGCLASAQQRVAPGVPPVQYQGQQQQPQRAQVAQQGGHYQAGAPGVPPQQYQQPPGAPPPQYQQQQQQYQQPQQYQQQPQQYQPPPPPPPQQQQYQPPPQQPPQPHGGGGHHPGGHNQRVLHNPNLNSERDHIKDHLEVPIDTASMSDQELQFHYFKMHDADNNNKLDGQELIKSLFHWHDSANHDGKSGHPPPEAKLFTDSELVNMIDPILDQDDKNRDGFIDYPEFVQAQRNAAAAAAAANVNTG